jgi:SAM-dependent methyltransferase
MQDRGVTSSWNWDSTLYAGSAIYYERGRLPYPEGLADAIRTALALDGSGRALDVGCGPGIIALRVARLFHEVVGIDPDADMIAVARRRAENLGITNVRWIKAKAEELPRDLRPVRAAFFAQSFHWMQRDHVARSIRELLDDTGAFVQVSLVREPSSKSAPSDRITSRAADIQRLVERYLGPIRRAGQGSLPLGTPSDEGTVLQRAGFSGPDITRVRGGARVERDADDIVASVFSNSASAPHLFGADLPAFERELRDLLARLAPDGSFAEIIPDVELRVWRPLSHARG